MEETTEVKLTEFGYAPGGKWDCGYLDFTAETSLGVFEWKEGPRHGDDSAERTVKLAGLELPYELTDHLDWSWILHHLSDPPREEGKWTALLADSQGEVEKTLTAWFEENRPELEEFLQKKSN